MVMAGALFEVKFAPWYPHKTGNLRNNATKLSPDGFEIEFLESETLVKDKKGNLKYWKGSPYSYIPFLEYGTSPHFIPNAFGRNVVVYHPGSNKHKGFIKDKSSVAATQFIAKQLNGKEIYYVND